MLNPALRLCSLFCFLLFYIDFVSAQTQVNVTDIAAQRNGDKINITYRMPGSDPSATYRVKIEGAINGQPRVPLQSVSGDTGNNVKGGKALFSIIWDALKDISQIETAEFYVTAEKVVATKPTPPASSQPSLKEPKKRKWLIAGDIMVNPDEEIVSPGIRIAFYKKWGGYLTANLNRVTGGAIYSFNYPKSSNWAVYLGVGAFYYDYDYVYTSPGVETGLIASFGLFSISVGGALDIYEAIPYLTAGLGFRF